MTEVRFGRPAFSQARGAISPRVLRRHVVVDERLAGGVVETGLLLEVPEVHQNLTTEAPRSARCDAPRCLRQGVVEIRIGDGERQPRALDRCKASELLDGDVDARVVEAADGPVHAAFLDEARAVIDAHGGEIGVVTSRGRVLLASPAARRKLPPRGAWRLAQPSLSSRGEERDL